MKESCPIAVLLGGFIFSLSTLVNAATVTYSFTAEINQTNTSLIPLGEVFTGTFTADPDPDTSSSEEFGPIYALVGEQTINSTTIGDNGLIATSGGIYVQDDRVAESAIIDKLVPEAGFIGVDTGIRSYAWNTQDNDATILSDSSLPLSFPLSELESAGFNIQFKEGSDYCQNVTGTCVANGFITELSVSRVPLPAAAWTFGSGLLGLAGMARRKRAAQRLKADSATTTASVAVSV